MTDGKFEEYKVVVCGPGGAGKSCLTNMLVVGLFTEEYDPTIEDSYRKQVQVDGEDAVLDILDTAGQEEYSSMLDEYLRKGQGFLLVYSITSRESFEEIPGFMEKMLRAKDSKQVPTVLVGNKKDLDHKREVPFEEGAELAKQMQATFLESSAKLGEGVEEAFYSLIRAVRKDRDAKGYSLNKTNAPGKEMSNKLKKKFARWGRIKRFFTRKSKTNNGKDNKGGSTTTTTNNNNNNNNNQNKPAQNTQPANNNTGAQSTPSAQPASQPAQQQQQPAQSQPTQQPAQQPVQQQPAQQPAHQPVHQGGSSDPHAHGGGDEAAYGGDPNAGSTGPNWGQPAQQQPQQQQPYQQQQTTQQTYGGGQPAQPYQQPVQTAPYAAAPVGRDHTQEPWFHGNLTGPEADAMLEPCEPGTFLVRASAQPGCFAVSWKSDDNAVRKSLVIQDASVGFYFSDVPHAPYPTLAELVAASSHVLQYPYVNRKLVAAVVTPQDQFQQPQQVFQAPQDNYGQPVSVDPYGGGFAQPDPYQQTGADAQYQDMNNQQFGGESFAPGDYSSQAMSGGEIRVGARVRWMQQHLGYVRFYGEGGFAKGIWVGIELDEPCGKNDGTVKGQRYFTCAPAHGIFTNPNKVEVL